MPFIVLHLDFHLPLRLRAYGFFDIGLSQDYFDGGASRAALERFAEGFALPACERLLTLTRRHRGRFRVSLSVSGMLLEQMEKGQKPLLESFRRLADTGCAEFVCGVSHHSLASLFSETEFRRQVALHRRMIRARFGQTPRTFRNTAGICDEGVARTVRSMSFQTILVEDAFLPPGCKTEASCRLPGNRALTALIRHGRFSGELTGPGAEALGERLAGEYGGNEIICLAADCPWSGGDDPGASSLLRFLATAPGRLLKERNWRFLTPSEAAAGHRGAEGRAGRSWTGPGPASRLENHLQRDAANTLYAMEGQVLGAGSRRLLGTWRALQASDYLDFLSTKGPSEGARGGVSRPFASPYDAYIHYMNILRDLSARTGGTSGVRP
ncbi:MAG: hypothetical protein QM256_08810 [Pseudomonadota bacterium]|jgi:alpha-amylase|nr:hypothetical protein [Pseudomonadota bacterium]NLX31608.1 hypothetical protein [Deltaproteobacteria bacterium]HNU85312.1 hypothetical protein [Syntrophales bacterium]HNZ34416.1 hypothetical protein [Syntrophales bacterium]HOF72709.1 hypothetical protein [Syntrophales bacterium]